MTIKKLKIIGGGTNSTRSLSADIFGKTACEGSEGTLAFRQLGLRMLQQYPQKGREKEGRQQLSGL